MIGLECTASLKSKSKNGDCTYWHRVNLILCIQSETNKFLVLRHQKNVGKMGSFSQYWHWSQIYGTSKISPFLECFIAYLHWQYTSPPIIKHGNGHFPRDDFPLEIAIVLGDFQVCHVWGCHGSHGRDHIRFIPDWMVGQFTGKPYIWW